MTSHVADLEILLKQHGNAGEAVRKAGSSA